MAVLTREEFTQKYGREPSSAPIAPHFAAQAEPPETIGGLVSKAAQGVTNFVGAKGISDQFGASLAEAFAPASQKKYVDFPSQKQVVGSAIQSGANLIPGLGEGGLLAKTAVGGATGYAMDVGSKLQSGDTQPFTPGIGTAVGSAIPPVGAVARPAVAIVGRLLKGIGSGVSGVSSKTIEDIVNNPHTAQRATDILNKNGGVRLLEKNARTIVNGVGQIRQEARQAFGNALGELKAEDIDPQGFRQAIQPVLDKYGSILDPKNNTRTLNNVEFSEQRNLDKAGRLIDDLSKTELNGLSLRNLMDKIDSAKYKTATSDERLSFNAFLNDLHSGVKNAITGSTDKLNEINQKFSGDMQLAEAAQQIFGKVQFKNLPEVVRASQKLEGLFSQKGLAPEITDRFMTRLGINPKDFRTTEAVRQISNKADTANSVGLSLGELARETTSAVVTPEMVRNISIATGLAKEAVEPFLKGLKTPARNAVIEALLQAQGDTQPQETTDQSQPVP